MDRLEIDAAFVRNLTTDPDDAGIIEAIITMASHLGLDNVAEGVETQQQCDFLTTRGCRVFQGYFFGKPMPADKFMPLVATNRGPRGRHAYLANPSGESLSMPAERVSVPLGELTYSRDQKPSQKAHESRRDGCLCPALDAFGPD